MLIDDLRLVARDSLDRLIIATAYADTWLRHTEAFDEALVARGWEWRWGEIPPGLFDGRGQRIEDPYA
jgi:hypothetical protein